MLSAKRVCATYFLRHSWEEKPADLHCSAEFQQYFNTLNQRIVQGQLLYRWLVTVEDPDKFAALIRRIEDLMDNMPAIRQGYTRLRVIYNRRFSPRINFQINDVSSVLIGFPTDGEGIGSGALLIQKDCVRDFQAFFDRVWDNALPIVDAAIYWENLRTLGEEVGYADIARITSLEQQNHVS